MALPGILAAPRAAHLRSTSSVGLPPCARGTSRKYCWTLLYMLVLMRLPSLHDYYACMVSWNEGALGDIAGKNKLGPLFPLHGFFCFVETIFVGSGVSFHGMFGLAGRDILDLILRCVVVEVFSLCGWLTHEDFALETGVDFLAVVEHRLILARVRCEWAWLRAKGLRSIWAPACQESAHVGNAGVGVVSLKGAPVLMPTFAAAQFQRFFDTGRAIRCLLPVGGGRFLNLVVLYKYQGTDTDSEQLALTEQLFDAALGEVAVVARGSPCLLAGEFNEGPNKIPCLSKGIWAGFWVDLDAAWSTARGQLPAVTCKRSWISTGGNRRDFLVGCPLAAAAVLSCSVCAGRWLQPHFAVSASFDCSRWSCRVIQLVPSDLLLGCMLFIRVGTPSLLGSRWSGRFMMTSCVSWHRLMMLAPDHLQSSKHQPRRMQQQTTKQPRQTKHHPPELPWQA